MELVVKPVQRLQGELQIPGDKSISHRAVMLGALASGVTEIENFLMGADNLSTINCFRAMGINCETTGPTDFIIHGQGLDGLQEPENVLDVGNSGTTMRLLLGILSGQSFFSCLTGDSSIRKRPMGRVTEPLAKMGAAISGRSNGNLAPLSLKGGKLKGIDYASSVASAQVKSALLLAGLYAEGETSVTEPLKSRDHSERMLKLFGASVEDYGLRVNIKSRPNLLGQKVFVPGDISSAAFFMVAGLIVPNSQLVLKNVGINPTRNGIIKVLVAMGANIELLNQREVSGEEVADIKVSTSNLKGTIIEGEIIPTLIDEIPIIAVAAAMAEGETIIKDAAELKVKETNRITTVTTELKKLGVNIEATEDGMIVTGGRPLKGATCQSFGDHRIAMAMVIAGLVAEGETIILGSKAIDVSFPGFVKLIEGLM